MHHYLYDFFVASSLLDNIITAYVLITYVVLNSYKEIASECNYGLFFKSRPRRDIPKVPVGGCGAIALPPVGNVLQRVQYYGQKKTVTV